MNVGYRNPLTTFIFINPCVQGEKEAVNVTGPSVLVMALNKQY